MSDALGDRKGSSAAWMGQTFLAPKSLVFVESISWSPAYFVQLAIWRAGVI